MARVKILAISLAQNYLTSANGSIPTLLPTTRFSLIAPRCYDVETSLAQIIAQSNARAVMPRVTSRRWQRIADSVSAGGGQQRGPGLQLTGYPPAE